MPSLTVERHVDAPPEAVFAAISDVDRFQEAVPQIVGVELLSEERSGVGTRWRETRRMGGREASVELEVTEHEPPGRLRVVSDEGGTVWDSVFTVAPAEGGASTLTLHMDARPHGLVARLTTPLMMGMMRKAIAGDLDAIKAYVERGEGG